MTTDKYLIEIYGPLITLDQLAVLLHRSRHGLRLTLRGNSALAQSLRPARRKMGRRVLFRAEVVAQVIDGQLPT